MERVGDGGRDGRVSLSSGREKVYIDVSEGRLIRPLITPPRSRRGVLRHFGQLNWTMVATMKGGETALREERENRGGRRKRDIYARKT